MNTNTNKTSFFEKSLETTNKIQECIEIINIGKTIIDYMYYKPVDNIVMEGILVKRKIDDFTNEEIKLITPNSWGYLYLSGVTDHPKFKNVPYENFSHLELAFLQENKKDFFKLN